MKFSKDNAYGKVLYAWWQDLQEIQPENQDSQLAKLEDGSPETLPETKPKQTKKIRGDRAGRAALRRCTNITQIVLTPAYQRLFHRLQQKEWQASEEQKDRLAVVAALLAHVREDDDTRIAKAMSVRTEGDRPCVSELRFLRVLESPDLEALFTGLRRVLPLMNRRANVIDLANDLIFWGDKTKKNWAYAYDWPQKSDDA